MQKSLFKKYLFMTMGVLLGSFIILGIVMLYFFSNNWKSEKELILSKNVYAISDFTKAAVVENIEEQKVLDVNVQALSSLLGVLSKNIDADIFITDIHGERIIGHYIGDLKNEDTKISEKIVKKAVEGYYFSDDNLGGVYDSVQYTVGIPFNVYDSETDDYMTIGAIFASTCGAAVVNYLSATLNVFLIASTASLLLIFIVVWLFSYRMVRPLRRMSLATKAFGAGDFSVRVPIESEDEIGQLSVAFNNMANSLSNSEGIRRSFIANVSHELKTPMTTIGGFIDGILDGTIPQEKAPQYLRVVSDEVKRLSRLVKSMLDLSRIDSGEMKLSPINFDMLSVVCSTVITFEQKIDDKNIEIRGLEDALPLMIDGDQDLLHQVVYNLIENAVKFTNEGGHIGFEFIDCIDRICLAIENSGNGISPDDLPMIFDKFYKTDKSRSQDKNGMGLGLYLVKTIINLHGGDISVQSTQGEVSRFEFYIPKQKPVKEKIAKAQPCDDDVLDVE